LGATDLRRSALTTRTTVPPFVRLLNEEFTTGIVVTQDSLGLKALVGDPSGAILSALVEFSSDSGATFSRVDSFQVVTDPMPQVRWVDVHSLANSDRAVVALDGRQRGADGTRLELSVHEEHISFAPVRDAAHTSGVSGATVRVNVVSPSALDRAYLSRDVRRCHDDAEALSSTGCEPRDRCRGAWDGA